MARKVRRARCGLGCSGMRVAILYIVDIVYGDSLQTASTMNEIFGSVCLKY
jgi:hypothetical protein